MSLLFLPGRISVTHNLQNYARFASPLGLLQFRRFVSDRSSAEAVRLSFCARTVICFHKNRTVRQQCGVDNEKARRLDDCRTVRFVRKQMTVRCTDGHLRQTHRFGTAVVRYKTSLIERAVRVVTFPSALGGLIKWWV